MNVLRWQRLSVLWRNWTFNQDPKEEVQRVDLQDEGGGEGGGGGREDVRGRQGGGEGEVEVRGREEQGGSGEEAGGGTGEGGGEKGEDGENKTGGREEKAEGGRRGVAEAGEKRGGGEAEGEREERGEEDDEGTGESGAGGGEGGRAEVMDSIGVDFEQKVQACDLDLGPEDEGCRPPESCWSEEAVVSLLQVDNSSTESDEALQREESQRRSRRRFRRINPRGEREVITTDGQEDGVLTTVGALPVS